MPTHNIAAAIWGGVEGEVEAEKRRKGREKNFPPSFFSFETTKTTHNQKGVVSQLNISSADVGQDMEGVRDKGGGEAVLTRKLSR